MNDFEMGRKHGLTEIVVIGPDGRMNAEAGEYEGMSVAEAQRAVVAGAARAGPPGERGELHPLGALLATAPASGSSR